VEDYGSGKVVTETDAKECERNTQLLREFVDAITAENIAAWEGVEDTPFNVYKYYRQSLRLMYSSLVEIPKYTVLLSDGVKVTQEIHLFMLKYLDSVADTILQILSRLAEANTSKTAKSMEKKLKEILDNSRTETLMEATTSHIVPIEKLKQFLFKLATFLNEDLMSITKEEFNSMQGMEKKMIVTTPEQKEEASLVLMAAIYSNDAYLDENTRGRYEGKWFGDVKKTRTKGKEEWSGFVVYNKQKKAIFVTFQGTRGDKKDSSLNDLLTDASALHTTDEDDMEGATVHVGFYNRYVLIKDDMTYAPKNYRRSEQERRCMGQNRCHWT